jgi:hypothetical protein
VAAFTLSDVFVYFSDDPNRWAAVATDDPLVLRAGPLLMLLGSLIVFWIGESLVLRRALNNVGAAGGVDGRSTRWLGFFLIGGGVVATMYLFAYLGIRGIEDFLTRNWELTIRTTSEGLTLFQLASSLVPVGLALVVSRRFLNSLWFAPILAVLLGAGFLITPSKAGGVLYMLSLLMVSYWRLGRMPRWSKSWGLVSLLLLAVVFSLAIKTQYRFTGEVFDTSPAGLLESFWSGASRLTGGDFQTYAAITTQIAETGEFRDGDFNWHALTNLVPRALWPGKPDSPVALFYYLNRSTDPSGAALMAQGSFYIDFGVPGVMLGMFLSGLGFGYFGRWLALHPIPRWRAIIGLAGLLATLSFVETGLLSFIPRFVGTAVLISAALSAAHLLSGLNLEPWRPAVRPRRGRQPFRPD